MTRNGFSILPELKLNNRELWCVAHTDRRDLCAAAEVREGLPILRSTKRCRSAHGAFTPAGSGVAFARESPVAVHTTILYGFVTCGGINYMQIALVSSDAAFYFLEGNIALALTRVK